MLTSEFAGALATLIGAVVAMLGFLYKAFSYFKSFQRSQEELKESIKVIKAEVTPNSGKSLKDVVNSLKKACDRIEARQKVLDQRSKAALHYNETPLFETDIKGRLTWCNESFLEMTKDNRSSRQGFDWLTVIEDDKRDDFLTEFNSCLSMCRKIDIETVSVHGRPIRFVGYPYTVAKGIHEGFLIHLQIYSQENKK